MLKHISLLALLNALNRKPKPWCYFETHAGAGQYRVDGLQAEQTGEFCRGAGKLLQAKVKDPLLAEYQKQLRSSLQAGYYPGSPTWAQLKMRDGDSLDLCELHPTDCENLKSWAKRLRRVNVHKRDGHQACRALLPGGAKRGLVLIDPSYEDKKEYKTCGSTIHELRKRFRAATIALWYPRLPQQPAASLVQAVHERGEEYVHATLDANEALGDYGMYGSGMLIINPPWKLAEQLRAALNQAASRLGPPARAHVSLENPS